MNSRQSFQAWAMTVPTKNGTSIMRALSKYPEVPPMWPNRATRRAVKHNAESRIPLMWRQRLAMPDGAELRKAIKGLH